MKIALKIIGGLVVCVVVAFAGLAIFIGTLDADKYRPQLVKTLSDKTGRKVTLSGPIGFSLGLDGVHISIQDASIANPPWASRPNIASMGKFEVAVGLLPLLAHDIDVKKLAIENADILLETGLNGKHNWDMAVVVEAPVPGPNAKAGVATKPATTASSPMESLSVEQLTITNSQLGMRGIDGKVSTYSVEKMDLDMQSGGAALTFAGSVNGAAVTAKVKTGITNLLSRSSFPFDADVTYGAFHLTAKGKADLQNSSATIDSYQLAAGKTTIRGDASAAWGGARPVLHGKLQSDHIDMADFKPAQSESANTAAPKAEEKTASTHMFNDAPLPLDGLKAADATFQVTVGAFVQGQSELKNLTATLNLGGGILTLAPAQATVGGKPVNLQVKVSAASAPAQVSLSVVGNDIDLGELQKLGGMKPFLTGTAGANIQLSGTGNSTHAIASSLAGAITITAEKGEILSSAASSISSTLAAIFSPGGNNSAINCLAVRFTAHGGLLTDNGVLIDSAASTVSGKGTVNLGQELIAMNLHAKTKLVDVGGLVPGLNIGGTLMNPTYSVDAVGAVKNLVGNLVSGNVSLGNDTVPDIQAAPAGQNACVYTLDHPKAASTSSGVLPSDPVGRASQQIQNIGNSMVKGLFGH